MLIVLSQVIAFVGIYYLGYAAGSRAGHRKGRLIDLPIGHLLGKKDSKRR